MIHTLNRVYVTLYIILYVYICVQQARRELQATKPTRN